MANFLRCSQGKCDIQVDGVRWTVTETEGKTVIDDTTLRQFMEVKTGRSVPSKVLVHKNRDGSFAAAVFNTGIVPVDFTWPEDESGQR